MAPPSTGRAEPSCNSASRDQGVEPWDLRPCPRGSDGPIIASMEVDRNGLEVLDREECLRLLATATLGRIGVTSRSLPTVLPVNFKLDGDRILVRTGIGTKLNAATQNAVVAFEVDDFDPMCQSGWSVVVTGVTSEITDPDERETVRSAGLARWAAHGDGRIVAISTELVSGRRVVPGTAVYEGASQ
jgi:uncharacterized protein